MGNNLDFLNIKTPADCCMEVARNVKKRRKEHGLTQRQLADKAGVSYASLKRFEQTGEVSFHSLARLASALDCQDEIEGLFSQRHYGSIQEILDEKRR